jgi:penicillin amidase
MRGCRDARCTPRWQRWIFLALAALVLLALHAGRRRAVGPSHRSTPTLDGELGLPGLRAPVDDPPRDAIGTAGRPWREPASMSRVGLGFVHAQERFFSRMDLTRRSAAGELSALFGRSSRSSATWHAGCTGCARGSRPVSRHWSEADRTLLQA